jgi:hypothetical protein
MTCGHRSTRKLDRCDGRGNRAAVSVAEVRQAALIEVPSE